MELNFKSFFPQRNQVILTGDVISFFEKLNEISFVQFFKELFEAPGDIQARLGFPEHEEPLVYAAHFLKKLSTSTKSIIAKAIESIVSEGLSERNTGIINKSFFILRSLDIEISKKVLERTIRDQGIEKRARFSAGMILLKTQNRQDVIFWQNTDFLKFPELMPAAIYFYCLYVPLKSLLLLNAWETNYLENNNSLKLAAEKTMACSSDRVELKSILKKLDLWIINTIEKEVNDEYLHDVISEIRDEKRRSNLLIINRERDFSIYPCISDILVSQEIIPEFGYYINSRQGVPPPKFNPQWQVMYRENVLKAFRDEIGYRETENIALSNPMAPADHNYDQVVDRIDFVETGIGHRSRTNLPLEFLFDHEQRRKQIGIMPLMEVGEFAVLYYQDSLQNKKFQWPDKAQATGSYTEWLEIIQDSRLSTGKIKLCTQTNTIVNYELINSIRNEVLDRDQLQTRPTAGELGRWLYDNGPSGIVVCDVGIAYQAMQINYTEGRPGQLGISFIPYESNCNVGLSYRSDDKLWAQICGMAFNETVKSFTGDLGDSWNETALLGSELKLIPLSLDKMHYRSAV